MTGCENVRGFLGAFLDGELPPGESQSVERHVRQCPVCRSERERLDRLNTALREALGAGGEVAWDPFWRGLERRLEAKRRWPATMAEWLESAFAPAKLAWAIPLVLVALIGLLSLESVPPIGRRDRNSFAAVESINAYGQNVALFRDSETRTTVIWLEQNQEGQDEAPTTPEPSPAF
ncbi:MAG TPA: zf-HC2 domain-containing protein [Candidatus Eisenbacteria bacterium]|nr:zf-HC2 domain-containing protein [Candidatus Eisenbacteria bacterium]